MAQLVTSCKVWDYGTAIVAVMISVNTGPEPLEYREKPFGLVLLSEILGFNRVLVLIGKGGW